MEAACENRLTVISWDWGGILSGRDSDSNFTRVSQKKKKFCREKV